MDGIQLESDMLITTCDVESLYTSIKHRDGLDAVRFYLTMSNLSPEGPSEGLNQLMCHLNMNDYNIRLTYKFSKTRMEFLDVLFEVDQDGYVHSDLYRKDTSVNSFLHANSAHPRHTIDNIPTGQFLRARRICSDINRFEHQAQDLSRRFYERGYSTHAIQKGYQRAKKHQQERSI